MKNIVAPMYDQGYAALIADLSERGLLGDTLVCNLAEFGRTPKVNPAGGRDHWPQCFTVYFAGGVSKVAKWSGRVIRLVLCPMIVRSNRPKLLQPSSIASG